LRKISFSLLALALLVSCRAKHLQVDKIIEDGIEVVLNHPDPYLINGQPVSFRLEEELRIDLTDNELIKVGIVAPAEADADSRGNIFILDRHRSSQFFISEFDKTGRFIRSIGRFGQGPGEIQSVVSFGIDPQDRIWVSCPFDKRILIYDGQGDLVREERYPATFWLAEPLENGGYLSEGSVREKSRAGTGYHLRLCDSAFHDIKLLDIYDGSSLLSGAKRIGIALLAWKARGDRIYVVNEQRGYEILVYGLDGRCIRKIRKEYVPVPYPTEFKKEVARIRPGYSTPDYCPPFNSFFIDDHGYLFVMTYEKGAAPDEYWHDIFDPNGVFIGRASLGLSGSLGWNLNLMHAVARNGRYYRLRFKEDGYPEMMVYRMIRNSNTGIRGALKRWRVDSSSRVTEGRAYP
jgi:hypothetical protein